MNAGERTISWLFEDQLQVAQEWSEPVPTGFRWWADKHAQTIELIGEEVRPDGSLAYLVRVQTELLKGLTLDDQKAVILNTAVMPFSSMSGIVFDSKSKTLQLSSMVRVHDSITDWMNPIISASAVLQIGEAEALSPSLVAGLGAEESLSGPANRGMRPEPDELAGITSSLIIPVGQEPQKWPPAEFQELKNQYFSKPPSLLGSASSSGFTVEFAYGNESSLCQVMTNQPHPNYGNGLFLLQSFPVSVATDAEGAKLALSMNFKELSQSPYGYGLGSYAFKKDTLHFTSFFPNFIYRPGLLPNIYFSCAQRAHEMSSQLTGSKWKEHTASPGNSSIGRLLRRFSKK